MSNKKTNKDRSSLKSSKAFEAIEDYGRFSKPTKFEIQVDDLDSSYMIFEVTTDAELIKSLIAELSEFFKKECESERRLIELCQTPCYKYVA